MKDQERIRAIRELIEDPFIGHGLTDKELEATRLVAFGYTQEEVAERLGVTYKAIQGRLNSACRKMTVPSSKHLTRYFIQLLRTIVQ